MEQHPHEPPCSEEGNPAPGLAEAEAPAPPVPSEVEEPAHIGYIEPCPEPCGSGHMPDSADPLEPRHPETAFAETRRFRHDGFTPKRRRKFLKVLRKTGCVADACRKAGISDSAAYKARRRDAEFRALWEAALSKAGGDLETLAWRRAVEGVEEEVIAYGKVVGTRRRYDERLFRMLLQASDPIRYGGQGFGHRKAIVKQVRQQVEAEKRMEIEMEDEMADELRERIANKVERLRARLIRDGELYLDEDGTIVPAGYVKAPSDAADAFDATDATAASSEHPLAENGVSGTESGAEWTDPEPSEAPPFGRSESENPRFSAESDPPGPRVRSLGGW